MTRFPGRPGACDIRRHSTLFVDTGVDVTDAAARRPLQPTGGKPHRMTSRCASFIVSSWRGMPAPPVHARIHEARTHSVQLPHPAALLPGARPGPPRPPGPQSRQAPPPASGAAFSGLVGSGRGRPGDHGGAAGRGGLRGGLQPAPAAHGPHRLPAQAAHAGLLGRRAADRRVRRREAHGGVVRQLPGQDARGHPGGRGRRVLLPPRHRPAGGGAGHPGQHQERWPWPGCQHHHHAAGAHHLPEPRAQVHAQVLRGAADAAHRAGADQAADLRDLRQPDLPGAALVRLCHGGPDLLRQAAVGTLHRPDGHAGRPAQGAGPRQPDCQPRAGAPAAAVCAVTHAHAGLHHGRAVPAGPQRGAEGTHRPAHLPAAGTVGLRNGPHAGGRTVQGRRLHRRAACLHHHPRKGPAGGQPGGAGCRVCLRPQAWLSRPRIGGGPEHERRDRTRGPHRGSRGPGG